MKILYFSWIREKIGLHEQIIVKPKNVNTIKELIDYLKQMSAEHSDVFKDLNSIKVAINYEFSSMNSEIKKNDEIAFFPPVTGG